MTELLPTPQANKKWRTLAICVALAAVTFAVFGRTLGYDFAGFDDDLYVTNNSVVAHGLTANGIAWVFTHADCFLYHPLTMLSLMADAQIYGLNAGGFHFTNVLLHAASAILLFLVLQEMTGAIWRSALVAAIFAIHPLRVESVAWIAERKDVLGGFFFMLTLAAYAHYVRKTSPAHYALVAAAFAAGLLSKPTTITLPFVLLLLDYWPLRRMETQKRSRMILEKIPLVALSAAAAAATVLAAHQQVSDNARFTLGSRLGNAIVAYAIYLRQMIWPAGLMVPYDYPRHGRAIWMVGLAAVFLTGVSALAWRERRARPWLLTGWLWYLGVLAPMIGIVQVGVFSHADRYTYLAQIGITLMLVWLAAEWRMNRRLTGGLAAGVLLVFMSCAWKQSSYWQNGAALWHRTLALDPDNEMAQNNLAAMLLQQGKLDEAIAGYKKTLQLDPESARVRLSLGTALLLNGNVDEAIKYFDEALNLNPNSAETHNNLGNALFRAGKFDEAKSHMERAVQLDPNYPQAYLSMGNLILREGKTDEAAGDFQKALQLNPTLAQAHYELANILLGKGSAEDAIDHYEKALQYQPNYAAAHVNLANALLQQGEPADAVAHYEQALLLDPQSLQAHVNLGRILQQQGDLDRAIAHYQKALETKPDFAEARSSLAGALAQKGNVAGALREYRAALRLSPGDAEIENSLAWLLAAGPDPALRDGPKAVELAQQAKEKTGVNNPFVLRTLAAAFAQAGKFEDAKREIGRAIELVRAANRQDLAAEFNRELARYQSGLPFPN